MQSLLSNHSQTGWPASPPLHCCSAPPQRTLGFGQRAACRSSRGLSEGQQATMKMQCNAQGPSCRDMSVEHGWRQRRRSRRHLCLQALTTCSDQLRFASKFHDVSVPPGAAVKKPFACAARKRALCPPFTLGEYSRYSTGCSHGANDRRGRDPSGSQPAGSLLACPLANRCGQSAAYIPAQRRHPQLLCAASTCRHPWPLPSKESQAPSASGLS